MDIALFFLWFAMGCETGLPPPRIAECRVLLSVVHRNSTVLASRVGFWRLRMNGFRSHSSMYTHAALDLPNIEIIMAVFECRIGPRDRKMYVCGARHALSEALERERKISSCRAELKKRGPAWSVRLLGPNMFL